MPGGRQSGVPVTYLNSTKLAGLLGPFIGALALIRWLLGFIHLFYGDFSVVIPPPWQPHPIPYYRNIISNFFGALLNPIFRLLFKIIQWVYTCFRIAVPSSNATCPVVVYDVELIRVGTAHR